MRIWSILIKKLKVIVPNKVIPLTIENQNIPHIIDVAKIGNMKNILTFNLFIILPNKKTRKNIENLTGDSFIVSTASGWMNKDCFIIYNLYFCSYVTHYRLTLEKELRDEPILLIVDSHISRENYLANDVLNLFIIDLLVLPGHYTHILQPFDVALFSPLKTYLKELSKINFNIEFNDNRQVECNITLKKTAQKIREQLIVIFKIALHLACHLPKFCKIEFKKFYFYQN